MADSAPIELSRSLKNKYFHAKSVQHLFTVYYDYFHFILPNGLFPEAMPGLSSGQRKEIRLKTWQGDEVMMSGLVHRTGDETGTEDAAAGEAYTWVAGHENWSTFRFFGAGEKISFFVGDVRRDEEYSRQATFHPVYDATAIHDYLMDKLEKVETLLH